MSSFLSGLSSILKPVASSIGGGKGGAYDPLKRILSSVPTTGSVGTSIGTILGGSVKQSFLGLGNKLFGDVFKNRTFGPLASQIWGNLSFSEGDGLQAMQSRQDPIMNIDWSVSMPLDPQINAYVEEISFATTGIDAQPFQRAGRTISIASLRTTGPISLTFYADNFMTAAAYIDAWKALVANDDGTFNYPSEYKQVIGVNIVDQAGNFNGTYFCSNCFPTGPYQYAVTSGSAERQRIVQEFTCDLVTFVPVGAVSVGALEKVLS